MEKYRTFAPLRLLSADLPPASQHQDPVWQLAWSQPDTTTATATTTTTTTTATESTGGDRKFVSYLATASTDLTARIYPFLRSTGDIASTTQSMETDNPYPAHTTSITATSATTPTTTPTTTTATTPSRYQWKNAVQTLEDQHKRTIRSVAFSKHLPNRYLATGSFDATAQVWIRNRSTNGYGDADGEDYDHDHDRDADDDDKEELYSHMATLEGHENEVKSVAWCPTLPLLATCSRDKSVRRTGEREWGEDEGVGVHIHSHPSSWLLGLDLGD